jgi:hypothetical protein
MEEELGAGTVINYNTAGYRSHGCCFYDHHIKHEVTFLCPHIVDLFIIKLYYIFTFQPN